MKNFFSAGFGTEDLGERMGGGVGLAGRNVTGNFAIEITFFGVAAIIQLGDRVGEGDLLRNDGDGKQKDK